MSEVVLELGVLYLDRHFRGLQHEAVGRLGNQVLAQVLHSSRFLKQLDGLGRGTLGCLEQLDKVAVADGGGDIVPAQKGLCAHLILQPYQSGLFVQNVSQIHSIARVELNLVDSGLTRHTVHTGSGKL